MQALMLAAGMGKRLGVYTQNSTKCMVPVNNKTLIEYAIEALLAANIKTLILVIGYKGSVLQDFLKDKYPQMNIIWINNPDYNKTNNIYSLYLALKKFEQDDTILLESDLIFDANIIKELIQNPEPNLAVVSKFERWMDGTVTLLNKKNNIIGMLPKKNFVWKNKNEYHKTVNIYKFSKQFIKDYYAPFLISYQKAYGKNEYYEQALRVISFLDSSSLKAYPVSGERWYEIDDMQDLSIASNRFADKDKKLTLMQNRYGGYWRFPAMLDFCYLVNPYFPPKSLMQELKANFSDLLTQYPSGANEQSLLAEKIFSLDANTTVIGNGAAELISAVTPYIKPPFLVPTPSFEEYSQRFIKNYGKNCIISLDTAKNNFSYTVSDIIDRVKKAEKENNLPNTVLLINPDNPSGNFLHKQEVLQLADFLQQKNIVLVFDESFIDFSEEKLRYSFFNTNLLHTYQNLIVIKSISKSYGVPGLRLGVLATSKQNLILALKKEISIWNINSFGEYFLQIFDKYKNDYVLACNKIEKERNRFFKKLSSINNITPYKSQANYILCKISGTKNATELTQILLTNYNIFIKDLSKKSGFNNESYIRLAVRSQKDNNKLIYALKEVL